MIRTVKGNVRNVLVYAAILATAGALVAVPASADRSVFAYPSSSAVFRYDPLRYELVGPGHPGFLPGFSIGGYVLWDRIEGRVPAEVYRAPQLIALEPAAGAQSAFVTMQGQFDLVVDGFSTTPTFYGNVLMRFVPVPANSNPVIEVDGVVIAGLTVSLGNIDASVPEDGGYVAPMSRRIQWSGATGLRITVFSDKNLNGLYDDGMPMCSVLAEELTVPTRETTWGRLKAFYRD